MIGAKRSGWLVGVLALALAGEAMPASGDVPESVTIPLKVVNVPVVGIKVGIEISLGGGPLKLYTFDTGSSGMYAAYNPAWWPTLQPVSGPPLSQSYGSNLQLEANPVSTVVGIPTDQGLINVTAEVGQVTQASGNSDGDHWLANVAAGKPPLYGMFFGDFGSGLTKPDQGLFAVLPQLPGNLSSGFAVQLGCGGGSAKSKVVVGLTDAIRSRVTSWVKMEKDPTSPPFPNSNQPTYKQAVLNGHFLVARDGAPFKFFVPALLDTGGGTTNIHQQNPHQQNPGLIVPHALVVKPGEQTTQIVSGAAFQVTAPGTTADNGFDMAFITGSIPTIDQVDVLEPKDAMAEVNLGLIPFFRYDVVFDVARGNVGFAPCSAATGSPAPVPLLSSWATGVLLLAFALFAALAMRNRRRRATEPE